MRIALALTALLCATGAQAQLLRCEAPGGKATYVNGDCPPGTRAVKSIEAVPPASETDRKAAQARATAEAKQAEALARQQRATEDKQAKERIAQAKQDEAQRRECAKLKVRLQHAQEDYDRASSKQRDAAERKLRQARENLEAQCPQ